jgi:hypothetical protein
VTDGDSEDLEDLLNDTSQDDSDAKIGGVLETYLATVKGNIMSALGSSHLPPCYQQGQFWIHLQVLILQCIKLRGAWIQMC